MRSKPSPVKLGMRKDSLLFSFLLNIVFEFLARAIRQEKNIREYK
jgi:hypothetical protein